MSNAHPYFSLKNLGKSEHYTQQNIVEIQEAQKTPSMIKTQRIYTSRHTIVKLLKSKEKKKNLESKQRKMA